GNENVFGDLDFRVQFPGFDEFLDQTEVHNCEGLLIRLAEATLRQTPVQRHLTTFVASQSHARTRALTFDTTTSGFTLARTRTTGNAHALLGCAGIVVEFMKFHVASP